VTWIDAKGSPGCVAIRPFALPSCGTAWFAWFTATARGWIPRSGSIRIPFGGMRFYCWWRDACIYAGLERGRRWGFVIEWAPCSGGDARGFRLSLFVPRLHDAGRLPLGYLEVSFWGGVVREVIPSPSPAFPARLKRLLRRALALPAR
jgi:hypothetical protein